MIPTDEAGTKEGMAEKKLPSLLVIDDEVRLTEFVKEALEGIVEVETAQSVDEADMHLGLRSFDMVLADHLMPGETGLDFLVRTRKHFPEMKRLFITGYINPELISRAQNLADLSGYLIKPVNIAQLRETVQSALDAN